jgi:hypothetical protein
MAQVCETHRIRNSMDIKLHSNEIPHLQFRDEDHKEGYISSRNSTLRKSVSFRDINNLSGEKLQRKQGGWLNYMRNKAGSFSSGIGRIPGSLLNKLVQSGMQTPLVKYLLNPQTIKKALNNDPILKETYSIIMRSEAVQNLLTPEAFQIILDTETAENVITPENFRFLLDHPVVAEFFTPENIGFLLNSHVVKSMLGPKEFLQYLQTRTARKFFQPEVMHAIAYSDVFTGVMTPDILVSFLEAETVKNVMTKEAIWDALECPGAKMTMTQEMVDKMLGVEGVKNLTEHQELMELWRMYFKAMFPKNYVDKD